ncbi:uncharacterized protein [Nicotiana tomentosiformis]|uniref:uncharacterized protein n=1 Tax=Nicotiana tomentosiformis TaxID=4098 RepID=UPI00388CDC2A
MTVTQYESCFVELAHHALLLTPTEGDRVRRCVEGLTHPIRLQMAKETGSEISFQEAANVARRIKMVVAQERGRRYDKRPRQLGGFSGASFGGRSNFGRGHPPRPFHSALHASHNVLGNHGPIMPYFGQPGFSAHSAPITPATSQVGGGAQTPAACTPKQRVQVNQAPEYISMPPVAPNQHETRVAVSEAEQLRLERYKKYHTPTFNGLASDYALGFLEEYHSLPVASGVPALPRLQEPYYAPPVSSVPPARGAITSQSSRPGPTILPAPAATPPPQPARGGGRGGRGRPRGGGYARYYALSAHSEVITSDSVITDFDVILSMDWLSPHYGILDCHTKPVTLAMPGFLILEWRGTLEYTPRRVISFLKAQRMVEKGYDAYLAYVRDVSIDTPTVKSVSVVRDFPDVFPADQQV